MLRVNNIASYAEACECLKNFLTTSEGASIAVDVETTGLETLQNKLVLVTIATPDSALVFSPAFVRGYIKYLLQDEAVLKIVHHAPFDWSYLKYTYNINMAPVLDTKKLAKILVMNKATKSIKDTSLAGLARTCLGKEIDKTLATSFKANEEPTLEQCVYASIDAVILFPLSAALLSVDRELDYGAVITADDLVPMQRYLNGNGEWPKHGQYAFNTETSCPGCPYGNTKPGDKVYCDGCVASILPTVAVQPPITPF